jgi:hypothetical protein
MKTKEALVLKNNKNIEGKFEYLLKKEIDDKENDQFVNQEVF